MGGELGGCDITADEQAHNQTPSAFGIGTNPQEWWVADEIRQAFMTQSAQMHAANVRFQPGDIRAYTEGTVGWIADRPTLKTTDGRKSPCA